MSQSRPKKASTGKQKAPQPSEWQFVEDEEFMDNINQGSTKGAPNIMTRMFLVMCVLILGVYIIDIEEMAVVGDRVKNRLSGPKPFWQSTEEIMERMTADGQAFTDHQHQIEDAEVDEPQELPLPESVTGKVVASEESVGQAEEESEEESEGSTQSEEGGKDEAEAEVEEEVDAQEADIASGDNSVDVDEESGGEPTQQAEDKEVQEEEQTKEAEPTPSVAEAPALPAESPAQPSTGGGGSVNVGYSGLGVWPPPHCNLRSPVSAPPLTSQDPSNTNLRRLLSEAPTELLVGSKPPNLKLRNQVYDYIRDFYASNESCVPRSLDLKNQKCAGSGGGNSCRGFEKGACRAAAEWKQGGLEDQALFPWPNSYKGPNGVEPLKSWGRCAFIATGETVLKDNFGEDIDSHDTVVRYNTPIKGFEKHVGTKASLMWSKSKYGTHAKPSKGYIDSKVPGQSPLYHPAIGSYRTFRDQVYRLWFQARRIKEGKAAAGFARAVGLVKSGLCTQVSLYGFHTKPTKGGGKYFDRKAVVTRGHTIDWDGWLLKAMMDLGYICVYGE